MADSESAMDIVGDMDSAESSGASLLTKTLVSSPIIKDIFEANLRSRTSQDIIFIKALLPLAVNSSDLRIMYLNYTAWRMYLLSLNRFSRFPLAFAVRYLTCGRERTHSTSSTISYQRSPRIIPDHRAETLFWW